MAEALLDNEHAMFIASSAPDPTRRSTISPSVKEWVKEDGHIKKARAAAGWVRGDSLRRDRQANVRLRQCAVSFPGST
jgi:hypothetical protein